MRAYIPHLNELIYCETGEDPLLELSRFYAVLHGYKLSGKKFVIDRPTSIRDSENAEIYENDVLQVVYNLTPKEIKDNFLKTVKGVVTFDDGCFFVANDELGYMDYISNENRDIYNFKIIGHAHNKTI